MMLMTPQDHPFQRAEPAEYSKYRRSSRYTFWKGCRVRFCHTFPRELGDCTGSQEVQQLWQTKATFQDKEIIVRI